MTEEQFAQQLGLLGYRIHYNQGVWWQEVYRFYCKPASLFTAFDPKTARPMLRHSFLGYSHQVLTSDKGNRCVSFMVLEANDLRSFTLFSLKSAKRNQVRRGLESCEIRLLTDIEPQLERMREINISQAIRQERQFGSETPVRRYIAEADEWRAQVRREFQLPGHDWWIASVNGALAAYMVTYQVDAVRVIGKMKSDTDYLKCYPVDALYFTVLHAAAKDETCQRIVNGKPEHESLNHYKEQFLFKPKQYPYFSTHARLVELGKKCLPAAKRAVAFGRLGRASRGQTDS